MARAGPTFLYVEDDPMSRRIVEILLKTVMGFTNVVTFDNTANFLEKVGALPAVPDIIFLDIRLRPHDGYEVLKMLRNTPAYAHVTIVAVTANLMAHDVEHLKKAGFSGLIGKPILKDIFPQLVEKILAGEAIWFIP